MLQKIVFHKKSPKPKFRAIIYLKRGTEQIRTAVGAFAELSLAARPRYLVSGVQK